MLRGSTRLLHRGSVLARKRSVHDVGAFNANPKVSFPSPWTAFSLRYAHGTSDASYTMFAFADGACRGNPGPGGCGALIVDPEKQEIVASRTRYIGDEETNNTAEYHALMLALELAEELQIKDLCICMDSELIIKQMRGEYRVKAPHLRVLHKSCVARRRSLKARVEFEYVPREDNAHADRLANAAIDDEDQRRELEQIQAEATQHTSSEQ